MYISSDQIRVFKMGFGIVNVLALLFVITQISGTNAALIIRRQYAPIFAELSAEIEQSAVTKAEALAKAAEDINSNVDAAAESVDKSVQQLQQLVEHERREAERRRQDIRRCLNSVNNGIASLDRDVLDQCRDIEELDNLEEKIHDINDLTQQLDSRRRRCSLLNVLNLLLKVCFDNEIATIKERNAELVNEVSAGIQEAFEENVDCVNRGKSGLASQINGLEEDFRRCVRQR